MLDKLFWLLSALCYGLAIYLVAVSPWAPGHGVLHWSFWLLAALGTASATVGNALRDPGWDDQHRDDPARKAHTEHAT